MARIGTKRKKRFKVMTRFIKTSRGFKIGKVKT